MNSLIEGDGPNNRISSDLATLSELSVEFPWIPNASGVRPPPDLVAKKQQLMHHTSTTWSSMRDYLMHTIFEKPAEVNYIGQRYAVDISPPEDPFESRFIANDFPYQLEDPAGQHWVLWYLSAARDPGLTDELINTQIRQHLGSICTDGTVVWAWYENPKMSVPDLYHVQVFWKLQY